MDAVQLVHQLDDARRLDRGADAALTAMVTAADEVVAELQREQRHAEQCEHELLRARKATAAGEHRLALLIRVIHEFARRRPPPPPSATPIVATSTQPALAVPLDDDGAEDGSDRSHRIEPAYARGCSMLRATASSTRYPPMASIRPRAPTSQSNSSDLSISCNTDGASTPTTAAKDCGS